MKKTESRYGYSVVIAGISIVKLGIEAVGFVIRAH